MYFKPRSSQSIFIFQFIPELTPIQQFYKDKSIFLTGATGFLGKGKCRLCVVYVDNANLIN